MDNKTLDGLKKNKNITLLTLEKLCRILECTPNDIVEFIED
ncbi:TPA: helix-turn-helix domain-containing protein [Streptococcus suis]